MISTGMPANMSRTFLTGSMPWLLGAGGGGDSICIPTPSPMHSTRKTHLASLLTADLEQRAVVGSPKGSVHESVVAASTSEKPLERDRGLAMLIHSTYLQDINDAYYDSIPFKPGVHFFRHLRRHAPRKSGRVSGIKGKALDVVIPETLLLTGSTKSILRYSARDRGIVEVSLGSEWEKRILRRWRQRAKVNFPGVAQPVVAVLKTCLCQRRVTFATKELAGLELEQHLQSPPDNALLQCFAKSKGNRESVYRVAWTRNRKPAVFNLVSKHVFQSRSFDSQQEDDDLCVCPSVRQPCQMDVFRIRSSTIEELDQLVVRIISHLKQSFAREYGLDAMDFDQIVCDFVRTSKQRWCLLSLKMFTLSPPSYAEASLIKAKLASTRERQGDFFVAEDAIVALRREHRKGDCMDIKGGFGRKHSRLSRLIGKWAECKLCSRKFVVKSSFASGGRNASVQSVNQSDRMYITPTMALTLRNQLLLRRSEASKRIAWLQRLNYRNDAALLRVCSLCYNLWQANNVCLTTGGRFASMLTLSQSSIHLPGHPSYGAVPGSCSHVKHQATTKRFAITPNDLLDKADVSSVGMDGTDTILARVVFFFCEVIGDCEGELVTIQYKLHEEGVVNSAKSQADGSVKQMRLHYFLAGESELKEFCIRKSVRVEAKWKEQVYSGNLYFTKFLSSKLNSSQTLHSSKLVMLNENDEQDILRVEVATGLCCEPIKMDQLDPDIPLFTVDTVHYLHDGYFDMRPIPPQWLNAVVVPQNVPPPQAKKESSAQPEEEANAPLLSEDERKEYRDMITRLESTGGSERDTIEPSIVFATGAMSSEKLRKKTVLRRSWRLKQYALIWECIDFDRSGNVDSAELRSYIRQHSFNGGGELSDEYLAKALEEWSIDEMHRYLCSWVGTSSGKCQRKFDEYDREGKGLLEWTEVFLMAEQAFSLLDPEDFSFIKTKTTHPCEVHGDAQAFAIDLKCVQCTFEDFNPTVQVQVSLFEQVSEEMFAFTQKAADMLIKRFEKTGGSEPQGTALKDQTEVTQPPSLELQKTAKGKAEVRRKSLKRRGKGQRRKTATGVSKKCHAASSEDTASVSSHEPDFEAKQRKHGRSSTVSIPESMDLAPAEPVEDLLEAEAKKETLFMYIKHDNLRQLQRLFKETRMSADFMHRGVTPLHVAARNGNESVIRLLLAEHGNPNRLDFMGQTAKDVALEHGHEHIVMTLENLTDVSEG